ncbi:MULTISPECIES: Smr/MutS family protein [unclassified Thioalkalivibrio]|uniref:Smr/MutS family protein n=1 Tax=unclassified Thioalkalivibrio TaxID=2621013 RepID=UPI00036E7F54|nr:MULTISPECIES: Smr/MutS family protein [unclassified Thioalkalivibrio]
MSRLSIDLHECFRNGRRIDAELNGAIEQACDKRIKTVEIIHGKGSGQLKKRVLRFLQQPEVKARYHRLEKDSKNHGRLFVHFKH